MPAPAPQSAADTARQVRRAAEALGFGLVGIAPARPSEHAEAVRRWIAEGRHGEMHYLADHLDVRLDPARLLPGVRSIVAVADFYPAEAGRQPPAVDGPRGRFARYAWGDDYHKTLKKRLHQLADTLRAQHPAAAFRTTVDTAPILEREHAERAGLGWAGKHTLLIHPRLGSWMLLGLILTTLDLPTSAEQDYPARTVEPIDHCGTCTRCIDACPTGCITPHHVDATRCISYLTLEHRSLIDPALHAAMGDWVGGCDVCQEVCPHNQGVRFEGGVHVRREETAPVHPRYQPRELAGGLPLLAILGWSEEDRRRELAGSALKRMKLDMLKRNALIAAGNALLAKDDATLRQRITAIAGDAAEPDLVRDTARQVLDRLAQTPGAAGKPAG